MSDRAHDSYQRRLKDLPLGGQSALIHLTVRRFLCDTRDCPRRTVAEPFAQLPPRTCASPLGSTTSWSMSASRLPDGPAPGWLTNWRAPAMRPRPCSLN
ncbi:transposase family protein [Streptomyces sp. NBC_01546]|uniref:transposase family protein n=1 Tax=Streptomyces sp. NBC_01546 TaxID=2975872 RepID=UPI003870DB7F